jgi:hypothetical protein
MSDTFANDIERAAAAPIEAVVIGDMGWDGYGADERHAPGLARKGEVLTWDEARPLLDYRYDRGYGAPDCHAIYVWTSSEVLWVTQYDGSTWMSSAPRHPVPGLPEMPGG